MNKDLQNKIYSAYPKIFKDKDLNAFQSCMFWGITVGDGWFNLMDELCSSLQEYSDKMNIQVVAEQVKEKFGGLRFYYRIELGDNLKNGKTEDELKELYISIYKEIDKMIRKAEYRSETECEICGNPSVVQSFNGWLSCTCTKCAAQRKGL